MNEHLEARQRRRELLITVSFTLFSVLMIVVTMIEGWSVFYVPLIACELAFIWWSYIRGFRTYHFRAGMVTLMTCINVFLYGIQGQNFNVLIPTLCVEFVLLSLYEITRIMDIAIIQTVLLFLYHAVVENHFILPDSSTERNRMILQLLSLVILIVLCIYRIYHHMQEEADVVDLENQVRREQKIKDDFVANTSHELRTPVNTISGMCEILLQKSLPEDIHSSVLDIQMTGVELQNIITDVLDYSALEADTLELSPREYNITSTLNDVMNMTVFENREKQLEIIFDCDPTIPCLLEGDEQQLRRVLNDLISNAIKFTQEGGVTVKVTHRKEDYGINLIVSVKDTGTGMSLEEQERILRGFYQTDADRNRKSSGLGLGLTISSSLIKKMGGFLTMKSELGKGSEFTFAIPQKVVDGAPCISLVHPGRIRLVWYYNPESPIPSMRDAFVEHIKHFSDYFGIYSQRAASLAECKRRIAQGEGVHLILGQREYLKDRDYFDELSNELPIILIAEHNEVLSPASRIHVLYKPYNAIILASILNGRDQVVPVQRTEHKKFIAPTAKILVVDDNLMNLKVVEGLLRKYRIKIVTATSGEEALSMIESQDFDFVFMDHMMPGMDGVECFHHIRAKAGAYFMQVPIIALTANAIAGSREMFLSEGFSEFIAKPIDTTQMNEVLQRFIPIEKQIFEGDEDFEEGTDGRPYAEQPKQAPAQSDAGSKTEETKAEVVTAAPKASADPFAELPEIDKESAMLYCGSLADFRELAGMFTKSGGEYTEKLERACEDGNMKDYALLAHTIKSTSKTIGALDLSELAYGQEMAAKEERSETVRKQHGAFTAAYQKTLTRLAEVLGLPLELSAVDEAQTTEVTESANEASAIEAGSAANEVEDWPALREKMKEALASYESSAFEACLKELAGKTLGGRPVEQVLSDVSQKASDFDFDGAIEVLGGIGGEA